MPDPLILKLSLTQPALPVDVSPGGEIILRGSFTSTTDGSIVDAATTTWPQDAPGGGSIDAGGLIDFEAGGFHITSRDVAKHEVHAIAVGDSGPACAALQAGSRCLPLRVHKQAVTRLITMQEWTSSLQGNISVEMVAPPVYAPPPAAVPYLQVAGGVLAAGVIAFFALRYRKRRTESPAGQLIALGKRVREKLASADAIVAAPLAPAIETALKALRARRIDATSTEGKRIAAVLARVEVRLDESAERTRAHEEQQAADELVREFESALEAADEATLVGKV
jgi:hypothetical protein